MNNTGDLRFYTGRQFSTLDYPVGSWIDGLVSYTVRRIREPQVGEEAFPAVMLHSSKYKRQFSRQLSREQVVVIPADRGRSTNPDGNYYHVWLDKLFDVAQERAKVDLRKSEFPVTSSGERVYQLLDQDEHWMRVLPCDEIGKPIKDSRAVEIMTKQHKEDQQYVPEIRKQRSPSLVVLKRA